MFANGAEGILVRRQEERELAHRRGSREWDKHPAWPELHSDSQEPRETGGLENQGEKFTFNVLGNGKQSISSTHQSVFHKSKLIFQKGYPLRKEWGEV